MEDIFLNAFNEATAKEKAAQKAQGATANINQQSYEKCINILQKYANGQVPEWDPKDLDTLLKLLNDAGFSDKALQKINPILNNAKKQLQQQPAEQKKPEDAKAENPQGGDAAKKGNPPPASNDKAPQSEQKGDASKITKDGDKNVVNTYIDTAVQKLQSSIQGLSRDDVIAYIKTL